MFRKNYQKFYKIKEQTLLDLETILNSKIPNNRAISNLLNRIEGGDIKDKSRLFSRRRGKRFIYL